MSSDFSGESFQHLRSGFIPGTGTPAGAPQVNVEGLPIPPVRMRRLRRLPKLRAMVRETRLSVEQLVYPMFVCPGTKVRRDISSMPGCAQLSIDLLVEECKAVRDLGIPGVILFGIPEFKDEVGSQGYSPDGIVPMALRALKARSPSCSSGRTSAFANIQATGTAGCCTTTRWQTTRRWHSWRRKPLSIRRRAPT